MVWRGDKMSEEQNPLVRTFPLAWSVQDQRFGDYILPEKILRRELKTYNKQYVKPGRAMVELEPLDPNDFYGGRYDGIRFEVDFSRIVGKLTAIEIDEFGSLRGTVEFLQRQPTPHVSLDGLSEAQRAGYTMAKALNPDAKPLFEIVTDLLLHAEAEGTQLYTLRMTGAGSVGEDKVLNKDFTLLNFQIGAIYSTHVNEVA
jgi:hypothetical protein